MEDQIEERERAEFILWSLVEAVELHLKFNKYVMEYGGDRVLIYP